MMVLARTDSLPGSWPGSALAHYWSPPATAGVQKHSGSSHHQFLDIIFTSCLHRNAEHDSISITNGCQCKILSTPGHYSPMMSHLSPHTMTRLSCLQLAQGDSTAQAGC